MIESLPLKVEIWSDTYDTKILSIYKEVDRTQATIGKLFLAEYEFSNGRWSLAFTRKYRHRTTLNLNWPPVLTEKDIGAIKLNVWLPDPIDT